MNLKNRVFGFALISALWPVSYANAASFNCAKVAAGSVEALVCKTPALSALDDDLARVYKQAQAKAKSEKPPTLKAEQRGWLKARDECWKTGDKNQCLTDSYRRRIAELQAHYALVAGKGPIRFVCDNKATNVVTATFYPTQPSTLIASYGDSTSLMFARSMGASSEYQGRNESFELHDDGATVVWGYEATPMHCQKN